MRTRALVFGGSGTVGGEVVAQLTGAGIPTAFTFHQNRDRADALAAEHGARAIFADLREVGTAAGVVAELVDAGEAPDIFVHCAVISSALKLTDIGDDDMEETYAVNCRAPFEAARALAPLMAAGDGGDIVFVGALDRAQSLPLPVHFSASQGMLTTMAIALAKELGGDGIRVNLVALGLLEGGISADIAPELHADFKSFSALRRPGTPAEAARAIVYMALENQYMNGKVLPVNGGI